MTDVQQEDTANARYSYKNVAVTIFELEKGASKLFSP